MNKLKNNIQQILRTKESFSVHVSTDYGDRVEVQRFSSPVRLLGDRIEIPEVNEEKFLTLMM
ncbi:MAG: hypothetical protein VB084_08255 [Syntrophomonadaceae bacterium]|nr:hypothetical protein [Syntrophomonadaceae bacterium]